MMSSETTRETVKSTTRFTARTTQSYRAVLHHSQAGAKVGQSDVTIDIQQDIVRLDVSVE